jgi:hypothetical protein
VKGATEDGYGVYGLDGGTEQGRGYGGYFTSNTGVGVYGWSSADRTWNNLYSPGVYGRSVEGVGVYGRSNSTSTWMGVGVQGWGYLGPGGRFYGSGDDLLEAWEDVYADGYTLERRYTVKSDGEIYADGGYHCGKSTNCWFTSDPADFAEVLPVANDPEPGDVLVVNADGKLAASTEPYQHSVVGIYSSAPSNIGNAEHYGQDGYAPLALVGLVPVKASAENGPITPGDLLVASAAPGHCMHADPDPPQGTVIGKAMEGLDEGTGVILMLVTLQ